MPDGWCASSYTIDRETGAVLICNQAGEHRHHTAEFAGKTWTWTTGEADPE